MVVIEFNRTEQEGAKIMIMMVVAKESECMKQMIHSGVVHHSPVPEQQPPAIFPPGLYTEHNIIWYGISLWLVSVSCPAMSLPSS